MLDPSLLDEARREAKDLLKLERQVAVAKADYHFAIRRLHLAGGSLREIGAALGLSHQRVGQIVEVENRSWLRQQRGRDRAERLHCSFCGRSSTEVQKLVAGPRVHICNACIEQISDWLKAGDLSPNSGSVAVFPALTWARCSFCGKRPRNKRTLVGTAHSRICSQCVELAGQLATAG